MTVLREPGGLQLLYDGETDFFTVKVNHGGQLAKQNGVIEYVGGQVEYFDYCQIDYMSLLELEDFADKLGYEGRVMYYYRIGLPTHVGAFKELQDDMDVLAMVSLVGCDTVVEIYMVVPIKPLAVDFSSSKFDHVVISDDDSMEVEEENETNDGEGFDQDTYEFRKEEYGFSFDQTMPEREVNNSEAQFIDAEPEVTPQPPSPINEPDQQQAEEEGERSPAVEVEISHEHVDNLHDVDVEEEAENVKMVDSDYEQSEDEILVDKNKSSGDGAGAGTS